MQGRNAVYRMAANDGQVSHTNLTVSDNGHISDLDGVVAIFIRQFDHKAAVDLLHDLIDTGQQAAEQFHRPFFQCFGKDGMVCISADLSCDIPRLFPGNIVFIHQHTHQLRHSHAGVGIVQLEGNLFRQDIEVCVHFFETGNDSLHRCGNKEILLTQAQLLAFHVFIGRIQHVCQGICQNFFFLGLLEFTIIEILQVQFIFGNSLPQAQGIDGIIIIADDGIVIGHRHNGFIVFMDHLIAALAIGNGTHMAAKFYFHRIFAALQAPGIAVFQPVIGILLLFAVFINALLEDAVAVADAAAVSGHGQGGQGFQEAGRQTAQAPVAQTGVRLCVFHHIEINIQFLQRPFHLIKHFQIDEGVAEETAHQKFHGKVVNHLHVFFVIFIMGLHPFFCHNIPDSKYHRLIHFFRGGVFQCFTVQRFHVFPDHFFQSFLIDTNGTHSYPLIICLPQIFFPSLFLHICSSHRPRQSCFAAFVC